jgi:outer membrane protein assembly factor BamB
MRFLYRALLQIARAGVLIVAAAAAAAAPAAAQQLSVTTYHGHADRSGNFLAPGLTWARARALHRDRAFAPRFSGHLYAQPLYWQPPGAASGILIVATESDTVAAIDAASGKTLWQRSVGTPVALAALPCGNIDPLGITGTPIIDPARDAIAFDAASAEGGAVRHLIYALSLRDGTPLPGWPVDVAAALAAQGKRFIARDQNQRGALAILDGRIYVPYGGHYGDCGDYHGWVVGVSLNNPRDVVSWQTRARGGGIWAPGGIAGAGRSLFVATGNTIGARRWSDGEAVIRLGPDLPHHDRPRDFFAPANWRALDESDADLGGTNPLLLTVPFRNGKQALVLAFGKDRRVYVLDRDDLGGIGGALAAKVVARRPIITAPAVYPASGGAFVAFQGHGLDCPMPRPGDTLSVLKITAGTSSGSPRERRSRGAGPAIATAWCAAPSGRGSPIVTTTDGSAQPIVWVLGAEGDGRLHGYQGDTGTPLVESAPLAGLRHFQTLIAAGNRLYVGADGRLYAFSY